MSTAGGVSAIPPAGEPMAEELRSLRTLRDWIEAHFDCSGRLFEVDMVEVDALRRLVQRTRAAEDEIFEHAGALYRGSDRVIFLGSMGMALERPTPTVEGS